jgi:CHAD domain-containing protein
MGQKVRSQQISQFADRATERSLTTLASRTRVARKSGDAEAIHDFRTGLRRTLNSLRLFKQFIAKRTRKTIRRRAKKLRRLAGGVRDGDVAISLLAQIGGPEVQQIITQLTQDRETQMKMLEAALSKKKRVRICLPSCKAVKL